MTLDGLRAKGLIEDVLKEVALPNGLSGRWPRRARKRRQPRRASCGFRPSTPHTTYGGVVYVKSKGDDHSVTVPFGTTDFDFPLSFKH